MNHKKILLACCVASALAAAACASDAKTGGQRPPGGSPQPKGALAEQIEKSADEPLRVVVNEEPPFKIVEAKVEVISGPQFTEPTGAGTNFAAISSVPEITLVNTSGKTITEFLIMFRNPVARAGRTMLQRKVSIAPGQTYVVKRDHFLNPRQSAGGWREHGRPRRTRAGAVAFGSTE